MDDDRPTLATDVAQGGDAVVRVLVADDHARFRERIARLLSCAGGLRVVAVAADGDEAVALTAEHRPHVVLMDAAMPHLDGVDATRQIVARDPEVRVVVLTATRDTRQAALEAGAARHLLKDAPPEDVVACVRALGTPVL